VKKAFFVVAIIISLLAVVGCTSTPAPEQPKKVSAANAVPTFQVIDHKYAAAGRDWPEWVFAEPMDLEKQEQYKDLYLFKFEEEGANLDATKTWANNFSVGSEISKIVSTRVQQKFAGAQAGDKDKLGAYFENVVKLVSEATYSGAKKVSDYWVYKRYFKDDGKTEDKKMYAYYLLYSIPKATLQELINQRLKEAGQTVKPTPEQTTAMDRVKESFYEGF
jgi:hypothetical protein